MADRAATPIAARVSWPVVIRPKAKFDARSTRPTETSVAPIFDRGTLLGADWADFGGAGASWREAGGRPLGQRGRSLVVGRGPLESGRGRGGAGHGRPSGFSSRCSRPLGQRRRPLVVGWL